LSFIVHHLPLAQRHAATHPNELAIGATHHLFIATNSALQQFRILWTMDGTNCALTRE